MNRYVLLSLLCIPLLSVNLGARDSQPQYRMVEVQHFTKTPSVDLSQTFLDYFHIALKEELQKEHVAAEVFEAGAAGSADANDTVVMEGKITAFEKHMMGVRSLNMEINLYRKSDHRLITTMMPEMAYKGGLGDSSGKRAAEYVGKLTAMNIRKRLKDAPSLASLPPAAPAPASTPAASAPTAPGPSAVKLGIQARILTDDDARKLNASVKQGLYVVRVEKDSVADLMQMRAGDIIVEVNGNKVDGVEQLRQMLGNGSDVVVKVWRNGVVQALAVPQSL